MLLKLIFKGIAESPSILNLEDNDQIQLIVSSSNYNCPGNQIKSNIIEMDCLPTSIESNFIEELKIYPNPAKDFIAWDVKNRFELYNAVGEIVKQGFDNQVDVSNLSNGIYLIKIQNITQRIIKQ